MSNPHLQYATPSNLGRATLRTIATHQRAINLCLLAYIALYVAVFVVPPPLKILVVLLLLGVMITGAVFVFLLSLSVYSQALGIILGFLALIPLIGLISLRVVNGKATRILRANGIKVGLLGANPKGIADGI